MGKRRGAKRGASQNAANGDDSPTKHGRLSADQQSGGKRKDKIPTRSPSAAKQVSPISAVENTRTVENSSEPGRLDFAAPDRLLASLLAPDVTPTAFFEEFWEKKPLVVHRGGDSRTVAGCYYGVGFSREELLRLLAEHRIHFGQDINVCRYVASRRENLNGTGRATAGKVKNLFDNKRATLQFHQPQRFQDWLWRICELLESYFHSLVGANVYMTPGGSQGLAPHYDDVEVLILQLEGKKHWRLYSPPTELPRDYSRDLNQEEIGQPTHDFILETGDLLYFPRGTVHQADTPADCPYSTHVTISTYQRSSYGDLLSLALPRILNSAIEGSLDFRKGLPMNYLGNLRTGGKSTFENLLGQLSSHVGDHLQQAANQMMCDFVANRLPSYRTDKLNPGPVGPMPTDRCRVKLAYPRHTLVALMAEDEEDDDEDEEEEDSDEEEAELMEEEGDERREGSDGTNESRGSSSNFVIVRHSLANSRTEHMMDTINRREPSGLRFPGTHHGALLQLQESTDWLDSSKLSLPPGDAKSLLVSLWAEGLLEVSK